MEFLALIIFVWFIGFPVSVGQHLAKIHFAYRAVIEDNREKDK